MRRARLAQYGDGKRLILFWRFVDDAAAGDSLAGARGEQVGRSDARDVSRKYDDTCKHPGHEPSFSFLFKLRIGGARGVSAQALVHRELFLRLPTAPRAATGKFARGAGINSAQRIDGFDGIVSTESEVRATRKQRVPGIRAAKTLRCNARCGPTLVVKQMRRLLQSDYAERGEAIQILRRNNLGELDAVAAIAAPICREDGKRRIEPGERKMFSRRYVVRDSYVPGATRYAPDATLLLCAPLTAMALSCVDFVNVRGFKYC